MSGNLAEMYYTMKLRERDIFFSHFAEVLGFMLFNALHTSYPKHHRLFDSMKFREILLDWCSEVFGGFRYSNCHTDREWYFVDSVDSTINTVQPLPMKKHKLEGISLTKFTVELSPLIEMHMKSRIRSEPPLRVTLSQLPNRPLTTLSDNPYAHSCTTKGRFKKVDIDKVREIVIDSFAKRHQIMEDYELYANDANKAVRKLRSQLRSTMKSVTSEYEYNAMMTAKEIKARKDQARDQAAAQALLLTQKVPGKSSSKLR